MNALKATYKPRIISLFPTMYHEPLQSDSVPFGKRISPVSLVSLKTLTVVHLMILHGILILADFLFWTKTFHIVLRASHIDVAINACLSRIIPNRRDSVYAIRFITSCCTIV
jgi:hypothetical protein